MARVLQYICGGLVIGILSVLVNIHPAAAEDCSAADFCKNGGSCPTSNETPCTCVNGYTGDKCETAPCAAGGNECGDNGKCTGTADPDFKCECENGWSGDLCKTPPFCTSTDKKCGDNGDCDTSALPYKCTCKNSYTGNTCATAPESSSPAVRLSLMSLVVSSIVCFIVL